MNNFSAKEFESISEFKQLIELPETKALALVTSEGKINYCNKSFESLFLLKENDDFNNLDSEPNISALINNLQKSKYANFHFELFVFQTELIPFSSYGVDLDRVFINGGEFFLMIFSSLEERKILEDKINNLHNALDYGNVSVIITNETGRIEYVSKAFEKILKKGIEELFGQPIINELSQFLNAESLKDVEKAIEAKTECLKVISSKEGDEQWFKELKFYPVRKDESENLKFILTAHDITNYILKNRISQNSERQQKAIINNITDPLVILKQHGDKYLLENANESFQNEFSISKENSLGAEVELLFPEDFYLAIIDPIKKIDEQNPSSKRIYFSNKSSGRDYQINISSLLDEYENSRIFIINLNDITEQLQNQKVLREAYQKEMKLNKLKTAFLANMSHEIRTPLNAIVGYADLLEDDISNKEYENVGEMTGFLREGVNRLLNLVDNILEVAKLESGEDDLDLETVSVNSILTIYNDAMRHRYSERNIDVNLRLSEQNPQIRIDESKFRKIITELLDNAVKYNNPYGKVLVSTERIGTTVIIEISDTGIGIRKDKLDQILEPFLQDTDEGYKRKYEGAGLGLTIASKLTSMLGGKMELTSSENVGTKVTLTFPLHN